MLSLQLGHICGEVLFSDGEFCSTQKRQTPRALAPPVLRTPSPNATFNLGRHSKYTGRIWRVIGFEIFLLPGRVHARPAQVTQTVGRLSSV